MPVLELKEIKEKRPGRIRRRTGTSLLRSEKDDAETAEEKVLGDNTSYRDIHLRGEPYRREKELTRRTRRNSFISGCKEERPERKSSWK